MSSAHNLKEFGFHGLHQHPRQWAPRQRGAGDRVGALARRRPVFARKPAAVLPFGDRGDGQDRLRRPRRGRALPLPDRFFRRRAAGIRLARLRAGEVPAQGGRAGCPARRKRPHPRAFPRPDLRVQGFCAAIAALPADRLAAQDRLRQDGRHPRGHLGRHGQGRARGVRRRAGRQDLRLLSRRRHQQHPAPPDDHPGGRERHGLRRRGQF